MIIYAHHHLSLIAQYLINSGCSLIKTFTQQCANFDSGQYLQKSYHDLQRNCNFLTLFS